MADPMHFDGVAAGYRAARPPYPDPEALRHECRRGPEDADATAERIAASALFAVRSIRRYRWTTELTGDEARALFGTFSDWSPQEVDEAATAVVRLGGTVTEHYTSWLIEASPVR